MDPTQYLPIRVSTLRGETAVTFDVFVRVGKRYILYARSGDTFLGERLHRLREKHVRQLYIKMDSALAYRAYLKENSARAYALDSRASMGERALIAQGLLQASLEAFLEAPRERSGYLALASDADRFAALMQREPEFLGPILQLKNLSGSISQHGVNVAALSLAFAQEVGQSDLSALKILAAGALIHDFRHAQTMLNVDRPISEFTATELASYHAHPEESALEMAFTKVIPGSVQEIVLNHHEVEDGSGFPKGLKSAQISLPVRCVSLADKTDRLLSFQKTPLEALGKELLIQEVGRFDLEHLKKMEQILKRWALPK